jgi:hypothetical protein
MRSLAYEQPPLAYYVQLTALFPCVAIDQPTVSAVARRSARKEHQRGEEVDGPLELLLRIDDLLHLGSREFLDGVAHGQCEENDVSMAT